MDIWIQAKLLADGMRIPGLGKDQACPRPDARTSRWNFRTGMGARNLVVRGCLFEDCAAIDKAAPQISAECVTPAGWDVGRVAPGFVGGDVLLEGNRFVRPSGPIYDFKCGANVVIRDGDREPLP